MMERGTDGEREWWGQGRERNIEKDDDVEREKDGEGERDRKREGEIIKKDDTKSMMKLEKFIKFFSLVYGKTVPLWIENVFAVFPISFNR